MSKSNNNYVNILLNTLWWFIGLLFILLIWTILSLTVFKNDHQLPDPIKCFESAFDILFKGYTNQANNKLISVSEAWSALLIAFGQAIACFVGSFTLALCFVLLSRYSKIIHYFMLPFVTLARSIPTAIIMCLLAVFLITVMPLVPIVVAFFIIFPMLYQGISTAINNVDAKQIEMLNAFNVSKWHQIKNLYIPATKPYIFSLFVAGFGLTFKIALASQMVQGLVDPQKGLPNYPSIGMYIANALQKGQYDYLIGWGLIAIFVSLVMEFIINEVGRICMPNKYNDWKNIVKFFTWGKYA